MWAEDAHAVRHAFVCHVGSRGALDSFFEITRRGSTPAREVRGGIATFFTMAYIVVLNPLIIGAQGRLDRLLASASL